LQSLKNLRIGVPRKYYYDELDWEVREVVEKTLKHLESECGCTLVDVNIDESVFEIGAKIGFAIVLYEILREISAYLYQNENYASSSVKNVRDIVDKISGVNEKNLASSQLIQDESKGYVSAQVYKDSIINARPKMQGLYEEYFKKNKLDCLVIPTTIIPARPIGGENENTVEINKEKNAKEKERKPTFMTYIKNTDPASVVGIPCISCPVGLTPETKLPVGLEFQAPFGMDTKLLKIAKLFMKTVSPMPSPAKHS